ncbi:protein GLUTAMINE DUMPER 3-like protein [Carex littledalei]|uniref:Protein GLUTAMINE DUMPER 3-like protein n=1 Tax=Carex littledalei TaxID=544730 RepID=A0A833RDD1_9POAL|nr:protein GLUTAMINE DUMPER 3-like protein [Carex littledalei]
MRTGAGFNVTATAAAAAMVATPSTSSAVHSAWHSPVPYLFGGLAAMLGLIAFALLILACSYWKLSGYLEGSNNRNGDADATAEKPVALPVVPHICYEEKIVVIMAGDEKPTFLATPMSSQNSSFGDKSITVTDQKNEETKSVEGEETSRDSQKENETTRDHQESSQRENLEEV